MSDQAEALRNLVLQVTPVSDVERQGMVVLVYETRAPSNASPLALQMALEWQRSQSLVSLVDVRRDPPDGLTPNPSPAQATLRQVIDQQRTLREAWWTGPCGLQMVRGDLGAHPQLTSHALVPQLRAAARRRNVIVSTDQLDSLQALLPASDHCVFVAAADPERVTTVYQAIKSVSKAMGRARCWLVIAQTGERAAAEELQNRLATACDRCLNLALSPLGIVPEDASTAAELAQPVPATGPGGCESLRHELNQLLQRLGAAHRASSGQSTLPPRVGPRALV